MNYEPIEVSNIVVSGDISVEIDEEAMGEMEVDDWDINWRDVRPLGVEFRYKDHPQINLHNTGSYIIRSGSRSELKSTNKQFVELLVSKGIVESVRDPEFSIKNIVGTITLPDTLNLIRLNLAELNNTQYEPEQFPAVTYKPDEEWYSANIYHSGKIVIAGCESMEELEQASEDVKDVVSDHREGESNSNPLLS